MAHLVGGDGAGDNEVLLGVRQAPRRCVLTHVQRLACGAQQLARARALRVRGTACEQEREHRTPGKTVLGTATTQPAHGTLSMDWTTMQRTRPVKHGRVKRSLMSAPKRDSGGESPWHAELW